jgi:hypothetical protein
MATLAECQISKAMEVNVNKTIKNITKFNSDDSVMDNLKNVPVTKNNILTAFLVDTLNVEKPYFQMNVYLALNKMPCIPLVWDGPFAYRFKLIETQSHSLTFMQFCVKVSHLPNGKIDYKVTNKRKVKLIFR